MAQPTLSGTWQAQGAVVVAGLTAAATMPEPALAARVEEEDEAATLRAGGPTV